MKQYKRHRYLNGKALCIHYLIFLLIECLRLYVKKYSIYFCMLQLYSILPLSWNGDILVLYNEILQYYNTINSKINLCQIFCLRMIEYLFEKRVSSSYKSSIRFNSFKTTETVKEISFFNKTWRRYALQFIIGYGLMFYLFGIPPFFLINCLSAV